MSRSSCIPNGLVVVGEIRGQGDLVIAGTVEGPVAIEGRMVIEASGVVRGDVKAHSIVIRGTLKGQANAVEAIRVEAGGRLVGDAFAERVMVVEGALLRGRITMTGAPTMRRSSAGAVAAPSRKSERSGSLAGGGGVASPPSAGTTRAGLDAGEGDGAILADATPEALGPSSGHGGECRASTQGVSPPSQSSGHGGSPISRASPHGEPPPTSQLPQGARRDRSPPDPVIPALGRVRARRREGDRLR
jgi:cytoskeletal protein CcmA (bactofilin family)